MSGLKMTASKLPTGIELRGDTLRLVFTFRGQRCRESLKGIKPTKANIKFASNKRTSILHEIATNTFDYASHFPDSKKAALFSGPAAIRRTVSDGVDHWLSVKKETTAKSTYDNYKSKADKHIKPGFNGRFIHEVTKSDIERWISLDLCNLKNKTLNEIMIIMRGVFSDAKADRIITENPTEYIGNRTVSKQEPDPFTKKEIEKILSTKTHRTQEILMMQFAFWTGVRVSELIAFGWDDVDFDRGVIKVQRGNVKGYYKTPKTKGSVREIELLQPAVDALKKQKTETFALPPLELDVTQADNRTVRKERWRPIWRNTNTRQPHASDGTIRERFWSNHLIKAGVRYRGPNHARHTFASQLLSTGVISKDWIAKQMGHTSTKMLDDHYAKWIPEDAPPMADMVNKIFGFSNKENDENAPSTPQENKEGF